MGCFSLKCSRCLLERVFSINWGKVAFGVFVLAIGVAAPYLFDGHSELFHDYTKILIVAMLFLIIDPQPILQCIVEKIEEVSILGIDLKFGKAFDSLSNKKDESIEGETCGTTKDAPSKSNNENGGQSGEQEKSSITLEDIKRMIKAKRRIVKEYLASCGETFIKDNIKFSNPRRRYAGYFMQGQYCNIVASKCAAYNAPLEIARKALQNFQCDICQINPRVRRHLKLTLCMNCPDYKNTEDLEIEVYKMAGEYEFPFSLYIDTRTLD